MTQTQHTPGPRAFSVNYDGKGGWNVMQGERFRSRYTTEAEAVRAVAIYRENIVKETAPDLLAALEEMVGLFPSTQAFPIGSVKRRALENAESAIAKARGEG